MKKIVAFMIVLAMLTTLFVVFTSCGKKTDPGESTETAAEDTAYVTTAGYSAVVGALSLEVYKEDKLVQTLEYPDASLVDLEYAKAHIQFVDFNFDGAADISLAIKCEGSDIRYFCWIYIDSEDQFVYSKELSALKNISIDYENNQIISSSFDENGEVKSYVNYEWKDGVLTELTSIFAPETNVDSEKSKKIKDNTVGKKSSESTKTRPSEKNTENTSTTEKSTKASESGEETTVKDVPLTTSENITTTKEYIETTDPGIALATGSMDDGWF